jgi:hypothetical protein
MHVGNSLTIISWFNFSDIMIFIVFGFFSFVFPFLQTIQTVQYITCTILTFSRSEYIYHVLN